MRSGIVFRLDQHVLCPILYTITTDREAHNLLKPFEIRGAYCCKEGPTTAYLAESNEMLITWAADLRPLN
jgi:hypothetical protein